MYNLTFSDCNFGTVELKNQELSKIDALEYAYYINMYTQDLGIEVTCSRHNIDMKYYIVFETTPSIEEVQRVCLLIINKLIKYEK